MTALPKRETFAIDRSRLECGDWEGGKKSGGGDVRESYSADKIASGEAIRQPFLHGGNLWCCISISGKGLTITGEHELEAYRLTPAELFKGKISTYGARCAEEARNDPMGFYDGVAIKCGGKPFVMHGPPAVFVAETVPARPECAPAVTSEQMSLFS